MITIAKKLGIHLKPKMLSNENGDEHRYFTNLSNAIVTIAQSLKD